MANGFNGKAVFFLLFALLPLSAAASRAAVDNCLKLAQQGAVAVCEQALKQAPKRLDLRRALARAHIELGEFGAAIYIYRGIAADNPNDIMALHDLSGSLGFVRQYREAADILQRLVVLKPGDATLYRALAVIYSKLKRPGQVLSTTAKAARLGDAVSMFDMFVYFRDGIGTKPDAKRAIKWAEKAAYAGHETAITTLIVIFLEGQLGETVNEARAIEWARRLHELRKH
jgi:TPR repeat protein